MATKVTDDLDLDSNEFQPDEHARREQQQKELKSSNIKAVFGSGAGRIALIAVVSAFVLLLSIGFYNMFKRKPPSPEQTGNASAAMLSAPTTKGDVTVTSDAEAALRSEAVNRSAAEAAAQGKPFMAPPILKAQDDTTTAGAAQSGVVGQNGSTAGPVGPASAASRDPNVAAQAERDRMMGQGGTGNAPPPVQVPQQPPVPLNWAQKQKDEIEPQIMAVMGRGGDARTFAVSSYALPDRTPKQVGQQQQQQQIGNGQTTALQGNAVGGNAGRVPFIQAGDGYYCELDLKINTDASRNDVLATCHQGKLNGAKLIGKYEPSKETAVDGSVTVLLSTLSMPGRPSIPITAIAIDELTGDLGLADDVDNHTLRKYGGLGVASLLKGLGKAASIVTGSTTTISTGGATQTQTVIDPITPQRQAKIAVGEVGIAFGESLARSSEQIKRTVKVGDAKGVRVVFLADVFDEKK